MSSLVQAGFLGRGRGAGEGYHTGGVGRGPRGEVPAHRGLPWHGAWVNQGQGAGGGGGSLHLHFDVL